MTVTEGLYFPDVTKGYELANDLLHIGINYCIDCRKDTLKRPSPLQQDVPQWGWRRVTHTSRRVRRDAGLEAVANPDEEGRVLIACLLDSFLEGVHQTKFGTDTEVDLAVLQSSRGVEACIEALEATFLEGVYCTLDVRDRRDTIGEGRTCFYRDSEVISEANTDTEIYGNAQVVEAERGVSELSPFLAESDPRSKIHACSEVDLGSDASTEAWRTLSPLTEEPSTLVMTERAKFPATSTRGWIAF